MDVLTAHEVGTAEGTLVGEVGLRLLLACEVEHHHVGFREPDEVDAVFVGGLYQSVVGIDELDILT